MPYDSTKDRNPGVGERSDFGRAGRTEALKSDSTDLNPYAKAVIVLSAGTLSILPANNLDGKPINFGSVPVGFIPPYSPIRRIMASNCTATVATIDE